LMNRVLLDSGWVVPPLWFRQQHHLQPLQLFRYESISPKLF
jgi:hypothetical protein